MKKLLLFVSLFFFVALCAMEKKNDPRKRILWNRTAQTAESGVTARVNPVFGIDTKEKEELLKQAMQKRLQKNIAKHKGDQEKVDELKRMSQEIQAIDINELKTASQELKGFNYAIVDGHLKQSSDHNDVYRACYTVQRQLEQKDAAAKHCLKAWKLLRNRQVGNKGTLTTQNQPKSPRKKVVDSIIRRYRRPSTSDIPKTTPINVVKQEFDEGYAF